MKRKLGCVEKVAWLHNKKAPNNFMMQIKFTGNMEKTVLLQALDILQHRYPPLKTRVIEDPIEGPMLVSHNVPPIPLRYLQNLDVGQCSEIIDNELNTMLPIEAGPLIRITCIINEKSEYNHLIVIINHMISDGIALAYFTNDLLMLVNQIQSDKQSINTENLKVFSEKLPIEFYFQDYLNELDRLPDGQGEISSELLKENQSTLCKNALNPIKHLPSNKLKTCFVKHAFTSQQTQQLVLSCREHKVTVTQVLLAALLLANYKSITSADMNASSASAVQMFYNIPINLRPYCQSKDAPEIKDMGCFTSSFDSFINMVEETDLWNFSKRLSYNFQKKFNEKYYLKKLYTRYKSMNPTSRSQSNPKNMLDSYMKKWLAGNQLSSLPLIYLSNLGKITFHQNYGNIRLNEVNFIVTVHDMLVTDTSCLLLVHTDTATKRLTLTMPYAYPIISEDKRIELLQHLVHYIIQAIEQSRFSLGRNYYV